MRVMNPKHKTITNDDPFYYLACSYISECSPNASPESQESLRQLILKYMNDQVQFLHASQFFIQTIGTQKPLEKICNIIKMSENPLPSLSNYPISQQDFMLKKKSRPWSEAEDLRLLAGIYKYGFDAWGSVANFVGNSRTKAQCSQRWTRGLDPRISKIQWTKQEDELLLMKVSKYGQKSWRKIAKELGNRSDVQCRYRFKQISNGKNESEKEEKQKCNCENKCNCMNNNNAKRMVLPSIYKLICSCEK